MKMLLLPVMPRIVESVNLSFIVLEARTYCTNHRFPFFVVAVHVCNLELYHRLCLLIERPKIWYIMLTSQANEKMFLCCCFLLAKLLRPW